LQDFCKSLISFNIREEYEEVMNKI
jgi:hypothetical protein